MTLRELAWMAEGKEQSEWDRAASLLTLTANINRDSKKKRQPYQIADFHPLRSHERRPTGMRICKGNRDLLKAFVNAHGKQNGKLPRSKTTDRIDGASESVPSP